MNNEEFNTFDFKMDLNSQLKYIKITENPLFMNNEKTRDNQKYYDDLKREYDRISFVADFEKIEISILIDDKVLTTENLNSDINLNDLNLSLNEQKKVKLRLIRLKLDDFLEKASSDYKQKNKNIKQKKIDEIIICFRSNVMIQLLNFYNELDIFYFNQFKGLDESENNLRVKESFVFQFEIPFKFFGWDRIKSYIHRLSNTFNKKNLKRICKYLEINSENFNTNNSLGKDLKMQKVLRDIDNYSLDTEKEENENNLLIKDLNNEKISQEDIKTLRLISFLTVVNSVSLTDVLFKGDFNNFEDHKYYDSNSLEEEFQSFYFENLLLSMFDDVKEKNPPYFTTISIFVSHLKELTRKKIESCYKIISEKERVEKLKDVTLDSYIKFLYAIGIILSFTHELNTEYYIVGNSIHIEISLDNDTFFKHSVNKTFDLYLEMSEYGKNYVRNYKTEKNHDNLEAKIENSVENNKFKELEDLTKKEISQHIFIEYCPYYTNLYKVYNEEDIEVDQIIDPFVKKTKFTR